MAKKKGYLICTTECEKCIHSKINDKNNVEFPLFCKRQRLLFGSICIMRINEMMDGDRRE